jgi:hypothetical protein
MKKYFGLRSNELLDTFKLKIQDIVQQVRDKLNKDAKDTMLIQTIPKDILAPENP